ncbi:MAG: corrinoid protein [Peptococcaceae bacterium]|jgi:methanogenic corrinoid protein MtbC1|nr:corrinoid protein [Peptococcaceae bacterium]
MSKIEEIAAAVEAGKSKEIVALVEAALAEGAAPLDILNKGMIGAMDVVGEKFQKEEIFIPEMLVAARCMKRGVDTLKPHLGDADAVNVGKAVIGTVSGDLHDIGKNLVAMMIESAGFEVNDLGVDVSLEQFVQAVESDDKVNIVACSALLTTTMPAMKATVAALNASKARGRIKIMIGGAPITPEFCKEIGADAYTPDAGSAAQKAKELAAV